MILGVVSGIALVAIGVVPGAGWAAAVGALGVAAAPLVRRHLGTRPWGLLVTPLVLGVGLAGVLDPRPSGLPAAVGTLLAVLLVHARWSRVDLSGDRATALVAALALVLAGATVSGGWVTALVLLYLPAAAVLAFADRLRGRAATVAGRWGLAVGLAAGAVALAGAQLLPHPSATVSAPGLDEQLDLGSFDRLTADGTVVATVRVTGGAPDALYLRGAVWDTFDERRWLYAGPAPRLRVAGPQPAGVAVRIVREPIEPPVVFDLGLRATITPRTGTFVRSADGSAVGAAFAPGPIAYELYAAPPFAPDGRTVVDTADARLSEQLVPESRALLDFVERSRGSGGTDVVAGLIDVLGRDYAWTDHPGDRGVDDPVAAFLARGTGTCAHFATVLALALRVEGLPTRVITGYAHGERVDADTFVFRQRHAHAWVAVRLPEGWVEIDPTPSAPAPVAVAAPAVSIAAPARPARAFGFVALSVGAVATLAAMAAWARRRATGTGVEGAWERAVSNLASRGIVVPDGPALAAARGLAHRLGDEGTALVELAARRQAVVWGGESEATHLAAAVALAARIAAGAVDNGAPST